MSENMVAEQNSEEREHEPESILRVKRVISEAPPKFSQEVLDAAKEPWTAKYGNVLAAVILGLEVAKMKDSEVVEQYSEVFDRLHILRDKFEEIKKQYPNDLPPEEIREDLISKLDVFKSI